MTAAAQDITAVEPSAEELVLWGSKILLSAVELGVFEALDHGPLDGEALRQRLGLHPHNATDFFDALVGLGVLDCDGQRYRNTVQADAFLAPGKPSYVGGSLERGNHGPHPFWGSLTEGLRAGRPREELEHGGECFSELTRAPYRLRELLGV